MAAQAIVFGHPRRRRGAGTHDRRMLFRRHRACPAAVLQISGRWHARSADCLVQWALPSTER